MFENKYTKKENPLFVFYISRIMRILPVFYLCNIFTILIGYLYHFKTLVFLKTINYESITFLFTNIFIIGLNQSQTRFLVPSWSLDIELQFYIILPFLLLLLKNKSQYFYFLILNIIIFIILNLFIHNSIIKGSILYYLIFFVIGIGIFKFNIKISNTIKNVFTLLFIFILIIHYLIPNLFELVKFSVKYSKFLNTLCTILVLPLLIDILSNYSNKKDMFLGNMSYSLYLCHWILIIPYDFYIKDLDNLGKILLSIIFIFSTYILGFVITKYFDLPIDTIRKKWIDSKL